MSTEGLPPRLAPPPSAIQEASPRPPGNRKQSMSPSMSSPAARKQSVTNDNSVGIPIAALNRFVAELTHDARTSSDVNDNSCRFLELNRQRVREFIEQPFKQEQGRDKLPSPFQTFSTSKTKSMLSLQEQPEFQRGLGNRSRFGDGDGSYFDKWLNGDAVRTRLEFDEHGHPKTDRSMQPTNGFKRHYMVHKSDDSSSLASGGGAFMQSPIVSYDERRRLRKVKEEGARRQAAAHGGLGLDCVSEESKFHEPVGTLLVDILEPRSPSRPALAAQASGHVSSELDLSDYDRATYFGDSGRLGFYDVYKQISRQKCIFSDDSIEENLMHATSKSNNERNADGPSYQEMMEAQFNELQSRNFRGVIANCSDEAEVQEEARAGEDAEQLLEKRKRAMVANIENSLLGLNIHLPDYNKTSVFSSPRKDGAEEQEVLLEEQQQRPSSPRTRFVVSCVLNNIAPKPAIVIRKCVTPCLDLQGLAIGDQIATFFSASLPDIPFVKELNLSANKLSDPGLMAVLRALCRCPAMSIVNLSKNKLDSDAAAELSIYLSCDNCNLHELILEVADIDDEEVAHFFDAINVRRTLRSLNLSGNLLGSHEYSSEKGIVGTGGLSNILGGAAIGRSLQSRECSLQQLNLSWNQLRMRGAESISRAIKTNRSLTHLDLSYNVFATTGGEILGDSLQTNKTLRLLRIANNNIRPSACFTIMSAIKTCTSLLEVDMSLNPIGEQGVKALSTIKMTLGDDVKIDVSGCALRVHDEKCWYDSSRFDRNSFSLDLSKPYERAVCLEVLRTVASSDQLKLGNFTHSAGGTGEILLERKVAQKVSRRTNEAIEVVDESDKMVAQTDIEMAKMLFLKYDNDCSGSLDKTELLVILHELGLPHSLDVIDQILTSYDMDGSGVVEMEEFVNFLGALKSAAQVSQMYSAQRRFMALQGTDAEYVPGDEGTVNFQLELTRTIPDFLETISSDNLSSLVKASKLVADSSSLIEYSLKSIYLKYKEAYYLYREMMKESGDKYRVLQRILPRVINTTDAHLLLTTALTPPSVRAQIKAFSSLGSFYHVSIGLPNGYYILDLVDEQDRACLDRLFNISTANKVKRQALDLGDTSQQGDFKSFRNIFFEGQPLSIDDAWLDAMPAQGTLEFDFVCLSVCPALEDVSTVSNARFLQLLLDLGFVHDHDIPELSARAEQMTRQARDSSQVSGSQSCIIGEERCEAMASHLAKMYSERSGRMPQERASRLKVLAEEEAHLSGKKKGKKKGKEKGKGKGKERGAELGTRGRGGEKGASVASLYRQYLDDLEDSKVSEGVRFLRIASLCAEVFANKRLSCCQLCLLLEHLPVMLGATDTDYTTSRVELIIRMFSILSDSINFDTVLAQLEAQELAMLAYRLGWLNMFSSVKIEGCYKLDLSRREEKQLARVLLYLAYAESCVSRRDLVEDTAEGDGDGATEFKNLTYEAFSVDGVAVEGFKTPVTWLQEVTMPAHGTYTVRYGLGASSAQYMSLGARSSLSCVTYARPHAKYVNNKYEPTLSRLDSAHANLGFTTAFSTKTQLALLAQKRQNKAPPAKKK